MDGRKKNFRPEGSYKYDAKTEREIAAVLKDRGLSGGYQWLLDHVLNGVRGCGNLKGKVERVSLSLPALQQLAARRRVKFYRGPRKAA